MSINKNKIIFVILAGGLSKRFGGGFKTFAKFNNKSIFERIESNLKTNKIDIVINTNFSDEKFINKNYLIIPDLEKDFKGPLAGIYASMNWLIKKHPNKYWIFTVPSDTPFLPNNLLENFLSKYDESKQIFIARCDQKLHPVVGMWNVSLIDDLKNYLNGKNRKIMDWVVRHNYKFVDFETNNFDNFFNINTINDLNKAAEIEKELSK